MEPIMNRSQIFTSTLLGIFLAVSAWIGNKTANTAEQVASIATEITAVKDAASKAERQLADSVGRIERKLDDAVSRREFDSRVLLLEAEQRKQDIRLREIDLEILKLKNRKDL
jgi:hypothetical protein